MRTAHLIRYCHQYDPTGNILGDGLHSYRYDAKNQLLEVIGVATYVYNGLGQRIAKNSNAVLTHYVYDETDRLIGEYDAAGQAIQETVYLFGQPVAVLKGTEIYNVHTDHPGSPRKITSQAGNTVWQWLEKPFGDAPVNQDPDGDGIAFDYNLRFPGQYFDKETGLYYNYHRYYDPQTGRYITSDLIGFYFWIKSIIVIVSRPETEQGLRSVCLQKRTRIHCFTRVFSCSRLLLSSANNSGFLSWSSFVHLVGSVAYY